MRVTLLPDMATVYHGLNFTNKVVTYSTVSDINYRENMHTKTTSRTPDPTQTKLVHIYASHQN